MRKNYHIIIASTIFSILLWVSVNMSGEYQTALDIPLVPVNLKEGKALRAALPPTVNVKFRGGGWQLASLYFSPRVRYELDLSTINYQFDYPTNRYMTEFVKAPAGVLPIEVKPETLSVMLDDYVERRVPIHPALAITFKEGFGQVGKTIVRPESVLVGGARNIVNTIRFWTTKPQKFANVKSDINVVMTLSDSLAPLIRLSQDIVSISIDVQQIAEQEFRDIPVKINGVPANREVVLIPPKMNVIIRGGVEQLAHLDTSLFSASVDFKTVLLDSTGKIQPDLSIPEGVRVIRRKPEQFQYVIRKKF
jgi:YbbR domain-containing protein